jgi:hypothetical protein
VTLRRVLPDTNVCYPLALLDLLLRLDEVSLHEVIWSEDLLEELREVWVRNGARSFEAAGRVCDHIRDSFAGQEVPRSDYEHLVAEMPGDDPDDHPHAAVAVARAPATIISANLADFPAEPLAALGVSVVSPDDYLCALWRRHPKDIVGILSGMAADRHRPPMTTMKVVDTLERAGVPRFARLVRARLVRGPEP